MHVLYGTIKTRDRFSRTYYSNLLFLSISILRILGDIMFSAVSEPSLPSVILSEQTTKVDDDIYNILISSHIHTYIYFLLY